MSDDTESRLDRFRTGPQLAVDNDKSAYRAYQEARSGSAAWLIVQFSGKDENLGMYPISHLGEVLSPSHQHLILFFGNVALHIKGQKLTKIVDLMQENKIKRLLPFHADRFPTPGAEETVITSIKRVSLPDALEAAQKQIKAKKED